MSLMRLLQVLGSKLDISIYTPDEHGEDCEMYRGPVDVARCSFTNQHKYEVIYISFTKESGICRIMVNLSRRRLDVC